MTTDNGAIMRAAHLGEQHGRNAADWLWDGNTDDPATFLATLVRGIEEGDPAVVDLMPWPDLSGEWADGLTPADLAAYVDADPEDDGLMMEVCDAYELAFEDGRDRRIFEAFTYYTEGEDEA